MKKGSPNPEKYELNTTYFKNRLFVNMTRGKKGVFIYAEDKQLNDWLKNMIVEN